MGSASDSSCCVAYRKSSIKPSSGYLFQAGLSGEGWGRAYFRGGRASLSHRKLEDKKARLSLQSGIFIFYPIFRKARPSFFRVLQQQEGWCQTIVHKGTRTQSGNT